MCTLSGAATERLTQLRDDGTIDGPNSEYEVSGGMLRCRICRPALEVSLMSNGLAVAVRRHGDGLAHRTSIAAWRTSRPITAFLTASAVRNRRFPTQPPPSKRPCLGLYRVPGASAPAARELQLMPAGATWFGVPERQVLVAGGEIVTGCFESHLCLRETVAPDDVCQVCRDICRDIPRDRYFPRRLQRLEKRVVVVPAEGHADAGRGGAGNGNDDDGDDDRGDSGNGDDDDDHCGDDDNGGDGGTTAGAGDGNGDARDAVRDAGSIGQSHPKTNYYKLPRPAPVDAARREQAQARRLHWEKFVCCSKLASALVRVRTWRERARSAAGRG